MSYYITIGDYRVYKVSKQELDSLVKSSGKKKELLARNIINSRDTSFIIQTQIKLPK